MTPDRTIAFQRTVGSAAVNRMVAENAASGATVHHAGAGDHTWHVDLPS
ncbi:hypothetical protein [Streptomyces sp. NPDC005799]